MITIIQNQIGNRCWLLYYYGWITHSILYIYHGPDIDHPIVLYIWGIPVCVFVRLYVSAFLNGSTQNRGGHSTGDDIRIRCYLFSLCTQCAHVLTEHAYVHSIISGRILHQLAGNICLTTSSLGYVLFMFTYSVHVHVRSRTWLTR
jgi:hypothetical protein